MMLAPFEMTPPPDFFTDCCECGAPFGDPTRDPETVWQDAEAPHLCRHCAKMIEEEE